MPYLIIYAQNPYLLNQRKIIQKLPTLNIGSENIITLWRTKPLIEQYFVSDITYIKSRERTHYLSLVTDAYSRRIMGYQLSDNMNSENVVKALKMAVKNRTTTKSLIHHSDRGLQYCSEVYQKELFKNNIIPSMTTGYDCYQNALAEKDK